MFNILLVIHCLLCAILIGLVLLQQGKGADMGAAFGGNSTTLFGAAGAADFITKLTTSIAVAFMITSILLVRAYAHHAASPQTTTSPLEGSVMQPQAVAPAEVVPSEQAEKSVPSEAPAASSAPAPEAKAPEAAPLEVKPEVQPETKTDAKPIEKPAKKAKGSK